MATTNVITHPAYQAMMPVWERARECYAGEDVVKKERTKYLPPTSGQIASGLGTSGTTLGDMAYNAYLTRSKYPGIVKEAVKSAIGIMHKKPPVIELPTQMEGMRDNATPMHESLELLLRRINTEQLISGRVGILGDFPDAVAGEQVEPTILTYKDLTIINWDDASEEYQDIRLYFVMLNESGSVINPDLSWEWLERYKLLALTDNAGNISKSGTYAVQDVAGSEAFNPTNFIVPNVSGNTYNRIPFVFINATDLSSIPDLPPLDNLVHDSLTIYRGEADYRQSLFMQGQDTLVRIGAIDSDDDEPVQTGAGGRIDVQIGGDAKYIGVSSTGLPEQREALQNDYKRAASASMQLTDTTSRAKESGEALNIRVSAQTATLPEIAMTGAAGLELCLKMLAEWQGYNPDEVSVTPNLEFTDHAIDTQSLAQLMQAKAQGAPISDESIHQWLVDQRLTSKTFEEELELLTNEERTDIIGENDLGGTS